MKKNSIKALLNKTKLHKSAMEYLKGFHVENGKMHFTDLNVFISIKTNEFEEGCVYDNSLLKRNDVKLEECRNLEKTKFEDISKVENITYDELNLLLKMVSKDDERHSLQGIFLDSEKEKLVSTNGITLLAINKKMNLKEDVIIGSKGIEIVLFLMRYYKQKTIDLTVKLHKETSDFIWTEVKIGDAVVSWQAVIGKFPKYEMVIPEGEIEESVVFSKSDLKNMLIQNEEITKHDKLWIEDNYPVEIGKEFNVKIGRGRLKEIILIQKFLKNSVNIEIRSNGDPVKINADKLVFIAMPLRA